MQGKLPLNVRTVKAALLGRRYLAQEIPQIHGAGCYAFFVSNAAVLHGVSIDASGLLYVGMTDSSLEIRNHFTHSNSGFSTLRRSLGALLKNELRLHAIPRATGSSASNVRNYRFLEPEEQKLTAWMTKHLLYGFCSIEEDVAAIEQLLIKDMRPPLNLTGWPNAQKQHLRQLRDLCCEEARKWQSRQRQRLVSWFLTRVRIGKENEHFPQ